MTGIHEYMTQFLQNYWMYSIIFVLSLWVLNRTWYYWSLTPSFASKVVLITGGGSGIGRRMAVKFADLKATVLVWDIFEDGMKQTKQEIESAGGKCRCYAVDITNEAIVNAKAEEIIQEFGNVDILINNAGVVFGKRILDASSSQIRRTLDVNLLSNFWTVRAFLPNMLARARARLNDTSSSSSSPSSSSLSSSSSSDDFDGHIVTVSSVCAFSAFHSLSDYCASKWGSFAFAESLRNELADINEQQPAGTRVHTTIVCPYFITTGMFHGLRPTFFGTLLSGAPLTEESVAARLVLAVRAREPVVVMPSHLWLMHLMHCLPVFLADIIKGLVNVAGSMATFHGRGDQFIFQGKPAQGKHHTN